MIIFFLLPICKLLSQEIDTKTLISFNGTSYKLVESYMRVSGYSNCFANSENELNVCSKDASFGSNEYGADRRASHFWYFTNSDSYFAASMTDMLEKYFNLTGTSDWGDRTVMFFEKKLNGKMFPDNIEIHKRKTERDLLYKYNYYFKFAIL